MQRVNKNHQVEAESDSRITDICVLMRAFAYKTILLVNDVGTFDQESKLNGTVKERLELIQSRVLLPERVNGACRLIAALL